MKVKRVTKLINLLLIAVIFTTSVFKVSDRSASAATTYITVEAFAKALANEIELKSVTGTESSGYVNALITAGILMDGEITSYTKNISRADALVLLNRADEYLYGDTLEAGLVELALKERISDISSIDKAKRTDVVEAYLKGFMNGYSNGSYSSNRQIKGSSKVSKEGALNCIKMLKNKTLRGKISPDGQLIRTNDLPKNAKRYPYILASYPNAYYEGGFAFDGVTQTIDGVVVDMINIEDYAAPADVEKTTMYTDFPTVRKENIGKWVNKVKTYMKNIFYVDYRTIDDEWIEAMIATDDFGQLGYETQIRDLLNDYVKGIKKNKTIVKYNTVAVDGSSLYYYNGVYYLRAYVEYQIVSTIVPSKVDIDTMLDDWPHNNILFSSWRVDLRGFQLGKWTKGYFDVRLSEPINTNGVGLGINGTTLTVFRKGIE